MLTRRYFVDLQANYVTVTWDAQGGTASESSRQVIKGQPIGALPTWSRDGYTFNGWFTAASDGSQINESTIVNDDVTYYAQYAIKYVTVNFNAGSNGIASFTTKEVQEGQPIGELPTVTANTGYSFNGWYTESTGGTVIDENTVVIDNGGGGGNSLLRSI